MKTILILALSTFAISPLVHAEIKTEIQPKVSTLLFNSGPIQIINTAAEDGPCTVTRTYVEYYKCSETLTKSSTCSVWTDMKGKECRLTCEPHTCPPGH